MQGSRKIQPIKGEIINRKIQNDTDERLLDMAIF